jgi:cardiolipin synthase
MASWKFDLITREAWETMLLDCASARETIDFEQYLFVEDEIGRRFLKVLEDRARAGVRVRILLDAAGSFGMFFRDPPAELMNAGDVQVRFFNPISPWRIGSAFSWYFRDHRRILLVDGKTGHTGGTCVSDEMADWRDTHFRITEDPVIGEMTESFERMWAAVNESGLRSFPAPKARGGDFKFVINSPRYHQRFAYHTLRRAIRGARSYIHLTSPYFVPDPRLFRDLRRAAKRKVDVRLLLPSPSDHHLLDIASNSYFRRAFRSGIKIFLYNERFLHAKTAVVDDKWATVGTTNLDNLSLLFNYEGNIMSTRSEMVTEIERQFRDDLTVSAELKPEEWRRRPFSRKVLEKLVWPLHRFL